MTDRDEVVEKLKAQLDQWNAQMAAWESAARAASAEAKTEIEKQVGIMKSRADDLLYRIELLKGASTSAWQDMARGAEEANRAFLDALEKARSKFKDV